MAWLYYAGLAAVVALPNLGFWLVFGNPLSLINRVLRRLRVPYSVWRIRGNWYTFRDEPGSLTPVIVANEIRKGLYTVKVPVGESCVDLGAHIGMFSIPLARENPGANFWALEPDPANYRNLVANIKRNNVGNVFPVNAGLSATSGERLESFMYELDNTGGNQTRPSKHGPRGLTIKEILATWDPTVLKVDVEGAEFGAIKGYDLASVNAVIMEIHGHHGDPTPLLEACRKVPNYVAQVIRGGDQDGIYLPGGKLPLHSTIPRVAA